MNMSSKESINNTSEFRNGANNAVEGKEGICSNFGGDSDF
jgi:hypothetical protein